MTFRDLLLGFIRVHILHHAEIEPVYGLQMMAELKRHGYAISPGTLYPMLRAMEADGLLEREDRVAGGRLRKYYRATRAGSAALEELREKIAELADEVVGRRGPAHLSEDPGGVELID